MTDRLRLFVAFDVPEERRRQVQAAVEPLRTLLPAARWTRVEDQHVTLKFIGWAESSGLDAIVDACRRVAGDHEPAEMSLAGVGAFPSRKRVRVLWAGIDDPTGLGEGLAVGLADALESLGIEREERRFTPHLTLARLKTPRRVDEGALAVDLGPLEPFRVDHIVVYRSHLSPKGARYEAIERCPLALVRPPR
ncbi:MAG: RNA 2',3'-cyclic phosphodiesterase [Actinomycetota bacterium]